MKYIKTEHKKVFYLVIMRNIFYISLNFVKSQDFLFYSVLPTNIRLAVKGLQRTTTVAYLTQVLVTKKNVLCHWTPVDNVIHFFLRQWSNKL